MKIYTIELSEDGLDNCCFTNIKALYNGILRTEYQNLENVEFSISRLFTYQNLIKSLKESGNNGRNYERCWIKDENGNIKVTIQEMKICKK